MIREAEEAQKPLREPEIPQTGVKRAADEALTTEQYLDQFVDDTPRKYAQQRDILSDAWVDEFAPMPAIETAINHIAEAVSSGKLPNIKPLAEAVQEVSSRVSEAVTPQKPPKAPPEKPGGTLIHDYAAAKASATRAAGEFAEIRAKAQQFMETREASKARKTPKDQATTHLGKRPKVAILSEKERQAIVDANPNASPKELMTLRRIAERKKLEKLQAEYDAHVMAYLEREAAPHIAAGRQHIVSLLDKIAPPSTRRLVQSVVKAGGRKLEGFYRAADRLIAVALNGRDPFGSAWHETVHALKGIGLFTKKEWDALVNKA
jgi:hypothetical protein